MESEGFEEEHRAVIEGATPLMNMSANDGARSSPHYGGEAVLIHPSNQGACGWHGVEDRANTFFEPAQKYYLVKARCRIREKCTSSLSGRRRQAFKRCLLRPDKGKGSLHSRSRGTWDIKASTSLLLSSDHGGVNGQSRSWTGFSCLSSWRYVSGRLNQ